MRSLKFLIRTLHVSLWVGLIFLTLFFITRHHARSADDHELHVFLWGDMLHPDTVQAFEKETGITLVLNYFDSNEELITKLSASGGEGYDLVIPSDYAVKILAQQGLLQPLDKSRCPFFSRLEPALLSPPFDPDNVYSVPYLWEVYGIGYDASFFKESPPAATLGELFAPNSSYRLSMTSDPVEAISLASLYLFQQLKTLQPEQFAQVKELLLKQKEHVEAYADVRARFMLATHNCPLAFLLSGYVMEARRISSDVQFLLPQEGLFANIESICITKATKKLDLVYQFLNFFYRPEIHAKQISLHPAYPSSNSALLYTEQEELYYTLLQEILARRADFLFFEYLLPEKEMLSLWLDIKAE